MIFQNKPLTLPPSVHDVPSLKATGLDKMAIKTFLGGPRAPCVLRAARGVKPAIMASNQREISTALPVPHQVQVCLDFPLLLNISLG